MDRISSLYAEEMFTDFTFIVKGKPFKVHKLILAASSEVMKRMFTAVHKEWELVECEIFDIEPHIFETLICFMYRYEVPTILGEVAHELYAAAHYYEVENLKEICLDKLCLSLSADNAIKSYALGSTYNLNTLTACSWTIIKR